MITQLTSHSLSRLEKLGSFAANEGAESVSKRASSQRECEPQIEQSHLEK